MKSEFPNPNDNTELHKKIEPSSVGSRADLKAGVDIAKVYGGYFSDPEVAQQFVDFGIKDIVNQLPKEIRLADFGGGKGFLTKIVSDYLKSQNHDINAFIVDANQTFLQEAKKEGLQTYECNLENCEFENADIITMRAVNHYNPLEKQLEILKSARESLKEGGFLISQISSGSRENCMLRSEIINLKSLGRAAEGESYHWTSVDEYSGLLKKTGFKNIEVVGFAKDCKWSPEEQWDRFHSKETQEAVESGNTEKIKVIENHKETFLREAYALINDYYTKYSEDILGVKFDDDGKAIINYKYPIIRCQK